MSTPALFQYFLLNESGQYYYEDANGLVQTSPTGKPLLNSPANWEKTKLQVGRSDLNKGVFRKSSVPIEFVKDGAKILRHILYKDGACNFDAYCMLYIRKRNDSPVNTWAYQDYYLCEIDFANEIDDGVNENGDYFKVRLLERGIQELLTEKLNIPYEIPLDDAEAITVDMSGMKIQAHYEWLTGTLSTSSVFENAEGFVFPMGVSAQEGQEYFRNSLQITPQGSQIFSLSFTPDDANKFLYTDFDFTADYNFKMDIGAASGSVNAQLIVSIIEKDMVNNTLAGTAIYTSAVFTSTTFNINVSGTYNFRRYNYDYFIMVRVISASTGNSANLTIGDVDFELRFDTTLPATETKGFRYPVFARKLIEKALGTSYPMLSTFLNANIQGALLNTGEHYQNSPYMTVITCGDGLRQISTAKIKTTLAEMFRDIWARWMAAYSIEGNNLRIERLTSFFDKNTVIATLPEINNFKRVIPTDYIYSSIKAGYPDTDVDKLNGKNEVNSEIDFKVPVKRVNTPLDITTNYHAGVYEIESIRSEYLGRDTTNSRQDNSTFLLEIDQTPTAGKYPLKRYSGSQVGNVLFGDTLYNIGLWPIRFILRHIPYLRSILNFKDGVTSTANPVTFQSGLKNVDARTIINGVVIREGASVFPGFPLYTSTIDKLFTPVIYEFDAQPAETIITDILANPYGVIRFYDNFTQAWYEGFILDAGIEPATRDKYNFRLLGSPLTNTDSLIY